MKIISIFALISLLQSDVPYMPDQYSLLCEGTDAIGFNWRGGAWVETRFTTHSYIVVVSTRNDCLFPEAINEFETETFAARAVCMNIRRQGEEFQPEMSEYCSEYYIEAEGSWDRSFHCDALFYNWVGSFDGEFRRTQDSLSRVSTTNPTRDSLLIEVGTCSQIG